MAAVWGAVLGLAAMQLIGMIFYSKIALGKPWCRAVFPGKTWEQIAQLQMQSFHIEFVVCMLFQLGLILAIHYVIGPYLGVTSIEQAVRVGLGLTLISALVDVPHCAFSHRPVIVFLIDHFYNGCVLVVACVSFVYFR